MNNSTALKKQKNISQLFRKWLLVCIVIAFAASTAFIYMIQTKMSVDNSENLLVLNIQDVQQDIIDASDSNLLTTAHRVANILNAFNGELDANRLNVFCGDYNLTDINIVDENGIITASTNPRFVGFDMKSGRQSREFMVLVNGETEYVQSYQPLTYDEDILRKYAGVALKRGGFIQVGYDAQGFQKDIKSHVVGVTKNRHVGESGSIIICDEEYTIVSDRHSTFEGTMIESTGLSAMTLRKTTPGERFTATIHGKPSYCIFQKTEGYYIIAVLPTSEAVLSRNVSVGVTATMELLVFIALFIIVYILLQRQIVDNIRKMNKSLGEITGGNLDVMVDVRSNLEFSALSNDINTTVDALKQHISDAAARIDQELEYAKSIQTSALPSVFPPYPHRTDFSIYAQMDTAKEVGGDFYDFYLLNDDTLGFLIADVSGKGIPAAMFMMKAKTIIEDLAGSGKSAAEIFEIANDKLCEGNENMMFVTAWLGILNLKTGELTYANAGHNAPLIKHKHGSFEYLNMDPGLVLGALDGIEYDNITLTLDPGDSLILYTDGVTEALDTTEELFGEARLLNALNSEKAPISDIEKLLPYIHTELKIFANGAEQADDITMLGLIYNGPMTGGKL